MQWALDKRLTNERATSLGLDAFPGATIRAAARMSPGSIAGFR